MAKQNKTAAPTFNEVVMRGKPRVVRAFLRGLVMGSDTNAEMFFSFTDGIHHEGKAEWLAEKVGIRAADCHVIVDTHTAALLKKLAKRIPDETGLAVVANRRVRSANMDISFKAYARRYNDEIVALMKDLPEGLRVRGFQHDVKSYPEAKGVEAYAAAHDYEASGTATVTGRIDLLVALKKKFADYPLIDAEDIVLTLS